ncbi:MAG: hypothetical protein NVS3B16_24750 [Vulcanimicrobiaceae bacterium]
MNRDLRPSDFDKNSLLFTIRTATDSVAFHEHPIYGDEAPAVAIHKNGDIIADTEAWDMSTARLYCGLDQ